MVIFHSTLNKTKLKIQLHYWMQSYFGGICCKNKRSKKQKSPLKRGQRKQKQMLYVTQKNNPEIVFLKSRSNEGRRRYRINGKTTAHISCRHNNRIDRTQNTNEENGRQPAWKGRNREKLYIKLSKPFS